MVNKKIDLNKYVAVTATTILVFVAGVLLGNHLASSKLKDLEISQQDLTVMLQGLEIKDRLLEQSDICDITWDDVWKEKVEMGKRLNFLESRFGKDNIEVLEQKKIYELIEVRTLLLLENIKQECEEDLIIALFFYTNQKDDEKGDWEECADQGYILDSLYDHDSRVNVFSFDINIKNPATDTLKQKYNITKVPAVIINDISYEGLIALEELKELI